MGLPMPVGAVLLADAAPPSPEEDLAGGLAAWGGRFEAAARRLTEEGSLWLFARHGWRDGDLLAWPHLLAARAAQAGLLQKSVLVRHDAFPTPPGKPFASAHELVTLLVRSLDSYHFDKTPLREPHVFKDLEWGRRSVGVTGYHPASRTSARYRPDGKDPGNVLARARRDANGAVLSMEAYPRAELAAKLALASSREGWVVATDLDVEPAALPGRRLERLAW